MIAPLRFLAPLAPLALLACTADEKTRDSADVGGPADPTATTGTDPTGGSPTGPDSSASPVQLNEVVPSNQSGLQDDSGAFPDWIELYNPGDVDIDLTGYALSEEEGWTDQWVFPEGTVLPAGGFLVVLADGDVSDGPLHTNFKLSSTGEEVNLYGREADGRPWLDTADFPALATDTAWARSPDGDGPWAIDVTPTPGAANGG